MSYLPDVYDLNDPDILTAEWLQSNKLDYDESGNLVEARTELQGNQKPNAKFGNGVSEVLRQLAQAWQGLAMPDQWKVAEFFTPPLYTTAGLPAATVAGEGSVVFDTTTNRLKTSDGAAWVQYVTTGEIGGGSITVTEVGGGELEDTEVTDFQINGDFFDIDIPGGGTVTLNGIGTGQITRGHLTNGASRSLIGRAANSVGAVADIVGAGANTVAHDDGTSLAFRTIDASMIGDQTLYSVDFSTLANNTLTDGAESINGFTWTIANAAAATTFAVENGTGIHFDAAASSTAYTTSSRTATNMSILISTLIPSWDPQRDYVIEVYFSSLTLGASGNRVFVCLENTENTGAERMLGGGRQNVSGTQRFSNQNEATIRTSTITTTNDCFALRVSAGQMNVCGGASSGGNFPSAYGHADALSATNGASVQSTTSLLTIAFVTGEAGGAMDAVLRRLRVRRVS